MCSSILVLFVGIVTFSGAKLIKGRRGKKDEPGVLGGGLRAIDELGEGDYWKGGWKRIGSAMVWGYVLEQVVVYWSLSYEAES